MTISRTHKTKNYTIIDNRILYNENLSWKAKSILFYALAQSDTWQFYKSEIVKHAADKETSFDSGLKELKKFGYLKITRSRNKNGKFGDYIWNWYETPQFEAVEEDDSKKEYLNPENPIQVKPYIGKSSTNNTNSNNTNNNVNDSKKNKKTDYRSKLKSNEERLLFDRVMKVKDNNFKEADVSWWIKDYGVEEVTLAIDMYFDQINLSKKKFTRNIGGYIRSILDDNRNCRKLKDNYSINRCQALEYRKHHYGFTITKDCVFFENLGKDIDFNLSTVLFSSSLNNTIALLEGEDNNE